MAVSATGGYNLGAVTTEPDPRGRFNPDILRYALSLHDLVQTQGHYPSANCWCLPTTVDRVDGTRLVVHNWPDRPNLAGLAEDGI